MESGVISFIAYYYGGGGGGGLGNSKVSIVYSIRMGGEEELCLGEVHPLCSLSSSVSNLIN